MSIHEIERELIALHITTPFSTHFPLLWFGMTYSWLAIFWKVGEIFRGIVSYLRLEFKVPITQNIYCTLVFFIIYRHWAKQYRRQRPLNPKWLKYKCILIHIHSVPHCLHTVHITQAHISCLSCPICIIHMSCDPVFIKEPIKSIAIWFTVLCMSYSRIHIFSMNRTSKWQLWQFIVSN